MNRPMTMKHRTILPAVAVALLAAACVTAPATLTGPDEPAPPSAATVEAAPEPDPAPIPDYDWHLNHGEDEVGLAYGMAESDDVRLSLHCLGRSGRLILHKDVEDGAPVLIHLESGGEAERFAAEAEESMLSGGVILTAEADADHPVFQRFRRVGWIASWVGERREPYAAHPGSETAIEDFFAACG